MNTSNFECPHKWISIYVMHLDYECSICGKNIFDVYGVDKFRSGELKIEDFYRPKKELINWDRYRIVGNNITLKYKVQEKGSFLFWDYWSTMGQWTHDFDGGGGGKHPYEFDTLDEAYDFIIKNKVDNIWRSLT